MASFNFSSFLSLFNEFLPVVEGIALVIHPSTTGKLAVTLGDINTVASIVNTVAATGVLGTKSGTVSVNPTVAPQ